MKEDFMNNVYIDTRKPVLYTDFIDFVKPLLTNRQREKVRKVLQFSFDKKKQTYKLPNWRLQKLDVLIQERAKQLLQ
jgi:hypothetical protein